MKLFSRILLTLIIILLDNVVFTQAKYNVTDLGNGEISILSSHGQYEESKVKLLHETTVLKVLEPALVSFQKDGP